MPFVLERQGLHLALLVALLAALPPLAGLGDLPERRFAGLAARGWLGVAAAVPIVHQVYVMLAWRLELHRGVLTRLLGRRAFALYATGFLALLCARLLVLLPLAHVDRDTLGLDRRWLAAPAAGAAAAAAWTLHSVLRHVGLPRAMGLDHFDAAWRRRPWPRAGAFRITPNAMYTFGFLALWVPGLLWASRAALAAAAFNHAYIWVHFFCTEQPDLRRMVRP